MKTNIKNLKNLLVTHYSIEGVTIYADGEYVSPALVEDSENISELACEGYTEIAHIRGGAIVYERL